MIERGEDADQAPVDPDCSLMPFEPDCREQMRMANLGSRVAM
jgi:hypothetical protein